MSRITPLDYSHMTVMQRETFDEGVAKFGHMTNMKRTLMYSLPAYHALMEWYRLFDNVKGFLGERLAIVFSHAISSESNCLICTTFMRRVLIDWEEDPDELSLDEKGEVIVAFGRAIAQPGNRVSEPLYRRVSELFDSEQIVALTAFAGLMVATNIVNNALEVDLDGYLYNYRKQNA